jgi:3-polyprenyl-4-hydroxybenzoate decarboxylase
MFIVVAIKQGYPGHAKQALVAASNTYTGILSKIVIVVDDDVDVTDLEEVMWAVCTRIDPARDVEILRRCPSNYLDPAVAPGQPTMTSRLLIDGTRPYEWRERFAPVISLDREAELKVRETWGRLLALDKMRDLNMNKAGS